jgi:hypothetical protein
MRAMKSWWTWRSAGRDDDMANGDDVDEGNALRWLLLPAKGAHGGWTMRTACFRAL